MGDRVLELLKAEDRQLADTYEALAAEMRRVESWRAYLKTLMAKAGAHPKRKRRRHEPMSGRNSSVPESAASKAGKLNIGLDRIPANGSHLLSPRDAIRDFLRRYPGNSRAHVLDAIIGRVATTSKNPRDMLRTTIGQMIKKGDILERDGKLCLIEEA